MSLDWNWLKLTCLLEVLSSYSESLTEKATISSLTIRESFAPCLFCFINCSLSFFLRISRKASQQNRSLCITQFTKVVLIFFDKCLWEVCLWYFFFQKLVDQFAFLVNFHKNFLFKYHIPLAFLKDPFTIQCFNSCFKSLSIHNSFNLLTNHFDMIPIFSFIFTI